MFCKNCGKELKDGQVFCPACGTRRASQTTVNVGGNAGDHLNAAGDTLGSTVQIKANTMSGMSKNKWIGIGAAVIIVIGILIFFLFIKSGKPEDTVAELETAINEMDIEGVMDCFDKNTNDLYDSMMDLGSDVTGIDLEDMAGAFDEIEDMKEEGMEVPEIKLVVLEVSKETGDSCEVTFQARTTYEGGTDTEEVTMPMKKEGREWKFSMAAFKELM